MSRVPELDPPPVKEGLHLTASGVITSPGWLSWLLKKAYPVLQVALDARTLSASGPEPGRDDAAEIADAVELRARDGGRDWEIEIATAAEQRRGDAGRDWNPEILQAIETLCAARGVELADALEEARALAAFQPLHVSSDGEIHDVRALALAPEARPGYEQELQDLRVLLESVPTPRVGIAIGEPVFGGTSGSVLFVDSNGNLAQDNAGLYYDPATDTLRTPNIDGSNAANGDITIQGTSHATRTTSYLFLQPNGGNVAIGTDSALSKVTTLYGNGSLPTDVRARGMLSEYYGVPLWAGKGGIAMVAGGTKAAPTSCGVNANATFLTAVYYDGTKWRVGAFANSLVTAVVNNTSVSSAFVVQTGTCTGDATAGGFTGLAECGRFGPAGGFSVGTATWNANDPGAGIAAIQNKLGLGTYAPTYQLSGDGNAAQVWWLERHTTAGTAGNNLTVQAGGATVGATDKDGGTLVLNGGLSTGTGKSRVYLCAAAPGGAGTGDRAPVIVGRLTSVGLSINTGADPVAPFEVAGLTIYANNAAAVAGGLGVGAFYRTGADPDPVCVVH